MTEATNQDLSKNCQKILMITSGAFSGPYLDTFHAVLQQVAWNLECNFSGYRFIVRKFTKTAFFPKRFPGMFGKLYNQPYESLMRRSRGRWVLGVFWLSRAQQIPIFRCMRVRTLEGTYVYAYCTDSLFLTEFPHVNFFLFICLPSGNAILAIFGKDVLIIPIDHLWKLFQK